MAANASENKVVYSKWIKKGTNTFIPTDNSQILKEVDDQISFINIKFRMR